MDIEQTDNALAKFTFPNKPEISKQFVDKMKTVKLGSNHFPLTFDFNKSNVFSYYLKFDPEIPEDSRQLR